MTVRLLRFAAPKSLLLVLALAGSPLFGKDVPANRLIELLPDGKGGLTKTIYSKYYDAGDWLIEHEIGVTFIVDHDHKRPALIPEWMDMKSADATGHFFIELHNFTTQPVPIRISKVKLNGVDLPGESSGELEPLKTVAMQPGSVPIFNYGKSLSATVHFLIKGQSVEKTLTLPRRTESEAAKFFGRGGTPPYPFAEQRKLLRN